MKNMKTADDCFREALEMEAYAYICLGIRALSSVRMMLAAQKISRKPKVEIND